MPPVVILPPQDERIFLPDQALCQFESGFDEAVSEQMPFRVGMEDISSSPHAHHGDHCLLKIDQEVVEALIVHIVVLDLPGCPFVVDVVRRIGDHEVGLFAVHELVDVLLPCGVSAHQAMPP